MGTRCLTLIALTVAVGVTGPVQAAPKGNAAVIQLLQTQECRGCNLADADLVHAQLRDADLEGAKLQRANLSQAQLDGADLRNADLSFTSLQGASLRGTDLRGSKLLGTDLRDVDLTGARLDLNSLEESHWIRAKGLQPEAQSHAALHNAGVNAAEAERWKDAEDLFGLAIRKQPHTPESWVARGISREKLGKRELAMQDLSYASRLYGDAGSEQIAKQLKQAAASLKEQESKQVSGNGVGSAILNGLMNTSKALLPLAMKLFAPGMGL